jgi:hypothetical protein
MKLTRKRGDTSNIFQVFIQDSSSTTGAGLTGLAFNTSGLTAYYHRDVDTTATAITLATMTVGTFTSSGFKEIDATNMPGWYQFCPPDTALAATSTPHSVGFHLKGATNMAPLALEVQLIAADFEDTVRLGLTALPNVASGSAGAIPTTGTGSNQISVSSGQVILQAGTGTGQLDFASGVVKANATQWLGGTIPAVNVTGVPLIDAKYLLGTVFSTPATAGIVDVNLKNIANAAVSASAAQLGVNVVNIGGTAQTARDIGASVLLSVGTGTGQVNLSSGRVPITDNIKKNTALAGFEFVMTDSTTHAPKTGATVTAQRSLDGAAFASCTNSPTEISNGAYTIDLSAADLNGNVVLLRFTGTSADDVFYEIITQP